MSYMSLPPRGTGLATGRAGARRYGYPRSDMQRYARHYGGGTTSMGVSRTMETNIVPLLCVVGAGVLLVAALTLWK